ncbi:MAG: ATP-dependent Clp protease ATP-binding subunit ClpX [Eubacterium sp.]|nr:ATP-dependent Clp protease ATP-binding subunit ClpX [Eubacterium sp.]
MCRRSENRAGRLIEIPGGICICADCMQKSFDSMQNGAIDYSEIMRNLPPGMGMFDLSNLNFFDGMFGGNGQDEQSRRKKNRRAGQASGAYADGSFGEGTGADADSDDTDQNARPMTMQDVMPPHKIKEALDEYVIGQEQAKKIMSVGVYNHYKRILSEPKDGVEIAKSNMLMIGPTGSGKTYLVQTLARLLNVPLAMTDATSLTEAGYIGDDIESVVSKLLMAADNDVERAEHGIIFIDEIDKIAKKKNVSQRDVSGEAVQQGLLKLLEGSDVEVPVGATNKNAMVPLETVNTSNILFICGGAFPDLELIIKQRLNKTASIGFQADLHDKYDSDPNLLQKVTLEDLRKFGMIPEFLGRMPVVFALHSLTEDMLVEVLKEPRNAILKQYERLLELDEVKLSFEDAALHAIAKKAMERDTGARALRAVIEEFMLDIMYEIPKDKNIGEVVITKEYIEHTGGPRIVLRSASVPQITGA